MKICFLVPAHWQAVMGGSQYQAKQLLEHLLETGGHEIYYLTRRVPETFRPHDYELLQIAPHEGFRRFGEFLDTFDLLRLLERISPDVIYQRVGCGYTGLAARYARSRRKRCVWHVASDQDVAPFDWRPTLNLPFRYIEKRLLEYGIRNVDAIVTQTRQQAEELERRYGRIADAVIPNYHPLPGRTAGKNSRKTVVWVANLKPLKRPEVFLQLARDLDARKDIDFVMIGKPLGRPEWCDAIVRQAHQVANLRFLGGQSQESVNDVLGGAHVLVNTSSHEGFSNTFIQSWLRSVPVVSLSVNPDGVFDERTVGVCGGTYAALKKSLIELLDDDAKRERMGEQARRFAEQTYANRANLERLAHVVTGSGPGTLGRLVDSSREAARG
jgi:glycosyltransferase involved in cell wall biosynthesis